MIWKTNAHGHAGARELAEGMFDVWLADYKFGNDACAQRLARTPGYSADRTGEPALGPRPQRTDRPAFAHAGPCGMLLAAGGGMAGRQPAGRKDQFARRVLACVAGRAACGIAPKRHHRRPGSGFCAGPRARIEVNLMKKRPPRTVRQPSQQGPGQRAFDSGRRPDPGATSSPGPWPESWPS